VKTTSGDDLPYLLMRSSVLKKQLVAFATEPRFEQDLQPALDAAAPDGTMEEQRWIEVLDNFIMRYRFPGGDTVIDRFLQAHENVDPVDRDLLLRWRDPVDGIFEVVRNDHDSSVLLNLIDDLEYSVYFNTGHTLADLGGDVAFVTARLAPLTADSWVVSGMVHCYPALAAAMLARLAIELARQRHEQFPGVSTTGDRAAELARTDLPGPPQQPEDLKIPKAMRPAAEAIIEITDRVCAWLLDEEYAALARKAVAKLARKRPSPISSGRPATWAGAVVYALGQINFLFDRASEPYATADDLSEAFGVAKSTLGTKAKQVRDALKLGYASADFLTESMVEASPFVWFVSLDGLVIDARQLSLPQQTEAFMRGIIPYIPALGRAGTQGWLAASGARP
jgi:hypothetical protein